jgi:hypothetical protein
MKTRWMVALSVLSVAAILGAGFAYVVAGDSNVNNASTTDLKPLLTEEQLADLRAMMDELRANETDMNQTMALVEAQVEQYITENLRAYNLTDEQMAEVLGMFEAIGDKMAEIREVAFEMREQGATFEEIREAIDPMMEELKSLQDQLVQTLDGYGISFDLPQPPHHHGRPEGPRPQMPCNCDGNCTCNCTFPPTPG